MSTSVPDNKVRQSIVNHAVGEEEKKIFDRYDGWGLK